MPKKSRYPDLKKPFENWLGERQKFMKEMTHYHSNVEMFFNQANVSEQDFKEIYLKPFLSVPANNLKYLLYMIAIELNNRQDDFKLGLLPRVSAYQNAVAWLKIQVDDLNFFDPVNHPELSALTQPFRQCLFCGRLLNMKSKRADLLKFCHHYEQCPGEDEKHYMPHKDAGCCFGEWGVKKELLQKRIKNKPLADQIEEFLRFCSLQLMENMERIKLTVRTKVVKPMPVSTQGVFSEDWEEMYEAIYKDLPSS